MRYAHHIKVTVTVTLVASMQVTRTTLFCVKTAGAQIHRLSVAFSVAISLICTVQQAYTYSHLHRKSSRIIIRKVCAGRWLPPLAFFDGRQQPHCGKGFSRSKLFLQPVFHLQVASCTLVSGENTMEASTVCLRFGKVLQTNDVDLCLRQSQRQCPFGHQRHKGGPSKSSRQGPGPAMKPEFLFLFDIDYCIGSRR